MNDALAGKVCLVTGASRGIGAAIAQRLAAMGGRIVVHYGHNRALAEELAARLPGHGHVVLGADLADPGSVGAFFDGVMQAVDRLDVLVNNAGIFEPHPALEVSAEDWLGRWNEILAVNLVSPAVLCQAAAKVMQAQGGGRIVNIGSRGAFRGEPDCPAYGASKAGLHAMSQSLAKSLGPQNIQVFAIAPGFVETDMARPLLDSEEGVAICQQSPMNRVAKPEEIAELTGFLATTSAEFMTGGIIDLNGASYLRT